jgi:hypothetical protein
MQHAGLDLLMSGNHGSLILTKEKECENKDETTIDMETYS